MKTSEFKSKIAELGFVVVNDTRTIEGESYDTVVPTLIVKTTTGVIMGVVTEDMAYWFKPGSEAFFLEEEKRKALFHLLSSYSNTKVGNRKEEEFFDMALIEKLAKEGPITVELTKGGWKILALEQWDGTEYNKYDFVYTYHDGPRAFDIPFVIVELNEWVARKQAEDFIKREYPNIYDPYARIAFKGERKGWK